MAKVDGMKAWVIVRDGEPVHIRLNETAAKTCVELEARAFHHETIELVPVRLKVDKEMPKLEKPEDGFFEGDSTKLQEWAEKQNV